MAELVQAQIQTIAVASEVDAPIKVAAGSKQADDLPVAIGIPVVTAFANVAPVAPPAYFKGSGMSPQAWGVLAAADEFTVRQQVKLFPEYCCGCPPCLAQPSSYMISVGMDKTGTDMSGMAFRADEVSDKWNRCCCHPNQAFKMEFRQYIPLPGEFQGKSSEFGLISEEVMGSWASMSAFDKGKNIREHYAKNPVAFTAVREGAQCCPCNGCFPWCINKHLGCFACCGCCLDGVTVVAGETTEETSVQIGLLDPKRQASGEGILGSSKMPFLGGHCYPTLHLTTGIEETPWAKLQGPWCFGGCSELCCDFKFPISHFDSENHTGDIAVLKKRRPRNMAAAAKELFSDADVFTVEFKDKSLTPEQKALILGNQILVDYMLFERGEQDKCGSTEDGEGCFINLCNMYCYGCICPCKLVCKKTGDS